MVAVLVGYKKIVGLRHRGVVDGAVAEFPNGVDHDFLTIVVDANAGMNERVELDGFPALCLEHVNLIGVACDGHTCFFPGENAALQIDDVETSRCELVSCIHGAASASAIDGHTLAGVESFFGGFDEVARFDIHIQDAFDVSFGKLLTRSDIHELDIGIVGILGKRLHVGVLEYLLAACRCGVDSEHGQ